MSWGPATVFIHERMADDEVVPGLVDRYASSFQPNYPIPMPSLNLTLFDIDNIDEDSLNPLPPNHTDNSSSIATTPTPTRTSSSSSTLYADWDPDTPTLKAWAKRELAKSRNQLDGASNSYGNSFDGNDDYESDGSGEDDDQVDTVGGRISKKSLGTTSLSSKEDSKDDSDYDGEDREGQILDLQRLAYRVASDGRLSLDYDDMSDSDSDSEGGERIGIAPDGDGEDYYDEEEDGDSYGDDLIDRYYHGPADESVDGDGDDEDDGEYDGEYDDDYDDEEGSREYEEVN
jgi:hypothetical protein